MYWAVECEMLEKFDSVADCFFLLFTKMSGVPLD